MTAPRRAAAFFDVDKTLLPGSSLYLLARGMYRRGYYTWRDIAGFALAQITFRVTGVAVGPVFRGVRAVMYNSPEERAMIQAATAKIFSVAANASPLKPASFVAVPASTVTKSAPCLWASQ